MNRGETSSAIWSGSSAFLSCVDDFLSRNFFWIVFLGTRGAEEDFKKRQKSKLLLDLFLEKKKKVFKRRKEEEEEEIKSEQEEVSAGLVSDLRTDADISGDPFCHTVNWKKEARKGRDIGMLALQAQGGNSREQKTESA